MRAGIYWARETFVLQFRRPRLGRFVEKMALRHLHDQVEDPALREKLRPRYAMGCKRILPTDEWYPALVKPNVEVVTGAIREVRPHSIVGEDGVEREVDTIIFGTGFHVTDIPIAGRIRGRDGRTLVGDLGRLSRRLQGLGRGRLPQPVLPRRPEHRARPQLDRVHDRGADRST